MLVKHHCDLWKLRTQIQQGRAISQTVEAPKIKNNLPHYFRIVAFSPKHIAAGECAGSPEDKGATSLAATIAKWVLLIGMLRSPLW